MNCNKIKSPDGDGTGGGPPEGLEKFTKFGRKVIRLYAKKWSIDRLK